MHMPHPNPHKRIPPTEPVSTSDPLDSTLRWIFLLLMLFAVTWFLVWFTESRAAAVVSSRSIGQFIRMSGPGGLQDRVVIETDAGSYPLLQAPAVTKGTPLVLELRGNGNRFVCDVPHNLCVRTTAYEFTPSASSSSSLPRSASSQNGDQP
jgi:hypothetical protein